MFRLPGYSNAEHRFPGGQWREVHQFLRYQRGVQPEPLQRRGLQYGLADFQVDRAAVLAGHEGDAASALSHALELKQTLLLRPMEKLLAEPHILSGWLSINRDCYTIIEGGISWNENPIELLADCYHYLNMDYAHGAPASSMIWDHDHDVLQSALDFYSELNNRLAVDDWIELQTVLAEDAAPGNIGAEEWQAIRAAHKGYQAGTAILAVLPDRKSVV